MICFHRLVPYFCRIVLRSWQHEGEDLFLLYNDLHSHFNYWPQIVRFLKDAKAAKKADNESCWIVDIGDHIDRVHPIAEAFMGKANVQLLNEAGYHFATIGNNEGITMDHR